MKGIVMRLLFASAILSTAIMLSQSFAAEVTISDDVVIHYVEAGSGNQTVVMVPGWTMSGDSFEKQLEHFEESKKYRVIALDPRGQGQSTKTSEGNFYEQHGKDLARFIEKLGLTNIVLVGWSSGGHDVLSYISQFGSGKLKGLVLLDTFPSGLGKDRSKEWIFFAMDDADGFRRWGTQGPLLDRAKFNDEFARWMVDNPTDEYLDWVKRMMNQTSNGTAALLNESSAYQEFADDLKLLEGKIHLLYYTNPGLLNVVKKWAAENTPSAHVKVLQKHMSFWEHPAEFNKGFEKFLDEATK